MIARVVIVLIALAATAAASPTKVLVLPTGGDAAPALRHRVDAHVQKLAHELGDVAAGDTTFDETATAVGCDPAAPECVDQVLSTVGVDELVWATATTKAGATTVTIQRATKDAPARHVSVALAPGDDGTQADAQLHPLFGPVVEEPPPPPIAPTPQPAQPRDDASQRDFKRGLGITALATGGIALIVGIALWGSASGTQNQINAAPLDTAADIQNVMALQAKADNYASSGNILVVGGVVLAGAGAVLLYLDHRHRTTVAPIAFAHGAGISVTFAGSP